MKHRHLNHDRFTTAAIEDILERGRLPDWAPLIAAIRADPFGTVANKTLRLCDRPSYAAPVFANVITAARSGLQSERVSPENAPQPDRNADGHPLPHPDGSR